MTTKEQVELTMFLVGLGQCPFLTHDFLDLGEELRFLIIMVFLDKVEPCKAIPDEIRIIDWLHVGCLKIDGVVSAEDGIVEERHVRCTFGEDVILEGTDTQSIIAWKKRYCFSFVY